MKYDNLRNKTVFDFCDDPKILDDIVIVPKESFLENLKRDPIQNGFSLLQLAEMTDNKALERAVEKEYGDDFEAFFNE